MRKREKRVRGEKDVEREDVTDMKHSQDRVAARNKTSWSPKASLNVTQAADHKGEMERKKDTNTHTQKKKKASGKQG